MRNGITLTNTVKNVTIALTQDIGEVILLESVNWGEIAANNVSYKYTGQVGIQVTNTTLETRDIEILGWVASENPGVVDSVARQLNSFVNPLEPLRLQYRNYEVTFYPSHSIRWGSGYKENNEVMRKFKIDGFAADPLFRAVVESKEQAGVVVPKFHFPLIIPKEKGIVFGVRKKTSILIIENKGDVPTGFKVEFSADNGTVKNPALINAKTQEFIKINKTLAYGERVVITTNSGEKSVIGYSSRNDRIGENYYKYRDLDSTWLQLEIGDNRFSYAADENVAGLAVSLYYTNKYLEVE